jgi:two-component system response regulator DesR
MIVDDHMVVVRGLKIVLEGEPDIDVVAVAGSVAEAIAVATTTRPDVILMDYYLPDGTGTSAAARIRCDIPNIEVVLLTEGDDPDALRRAVDAGCTGHLDKSRPLEEVAAAVRVAAAGRVVVSTEPSRDEGMPST